MKQTQKCRPAGTAQDELKSKDILQHSDGNDRRLKNNNYIKNRATRGVIQENWDQANTVLSSLMIDGVDRGIEYYTCISRRR